MQKASEKTYYRISIKGKKTYPLYNGNSLTQEATPVVNTYMDIDTEYDMAMGEQYSFRAIVSWA